MGSVKLEALNHIGVRVRELRRSAQWYAHLGFRLIWQSEQHKVACLRNDEIGVELNLIFNSDDSSGGKNVLMTSRRSIPGSTICRSGFHLLRTRLRLSKQQASRSERVQSRLAARSQYSFEIPTST